MPRACTKEAKARSSWCNMRILAALAVTLALVGCWLDPHRDAHIAEETAAACRAQLADRWNNLAERERGHYINDCLTTAGFRLVGCGEKGAIRENGTCWLRRRDPI